jgi:hypothetical protein
VIDAAGGSAPTIEIPAVDREQHSLARSAELLGRATGLREAHDGSVLVVSRCDTVRVIDGFETAATAVATDAEVAGGSASVRVEVDAPIDDVPPQAIRGDSPTTTKAASLCTGARYLMAPVLPGGGRALDRFKPCSTS